MAEIKRAPEVQFELEIYAFFRAFLFFRIVDHISLRKTKGVKSHNLGNQFIISLLEMMGST